MSTNQTNSRDGLGEFEHVVLLAILQLRDAAYGPSIAGELERSAGRTVSRGALYSTLGRLEEKGLLRWRLEEPTAERGGHAKRRFQVTAAGLAAVRRHREVLLRLWSDLDEVLGEAG